MFVARNYLSNNQKNTKTTRRNNLYETGVNGLFKLLGVSSILLTSVTLDAETIFDAGIGTIGLSLPTYPGSKEQTAYVLPFPYFYYKDENITLDREGLVGNLADGEHWEMDISFSAGIPVKSDDSSIRENMPDLDWSLEAGPQLLYFWQGDGDSRDYLRSQLFVRKAFATDMTYVDQIGYRGGIGLEQQKVFTLNNEQTLIWTNRLTFYWADNTYLDYYYGVSDTLATELRPGFKSRSGYAGAELSSGLSIKVNNMWLAGFVKYQNFSGSQQSASALMQVESNWSVGIGAVWILRTNRLD
jgi:outer membrane scaffolding protein for murein synthesis (MipA/OmpV family)